MRTADRQHEGRAGRGRLVAGSLLGLSVAAALSGFGIVAGPGLASEPARAALVAEVAQQPLDFAYYRQNIEPIFMRPRGGYAGSTAPCVGCHTWQATTPLKLQPLQTDANGGIFWTEEQSRQNFQVVSRLVTPGDPDNSRLLKKPLAANAGGTGNHTGGTFWQNKENAEWQVMAEWVRRASPVAAAAAPQPDFEFYRACVQPLVINPLPNQAACTECHAGGNRGFARPPSQGTSWSEEDSMAAYNALLQLIDPGYPEYSRFLHHPLARPGGGDFMHNGPRRWLSKNEPEWVALAAWIRGESRGSTCPAALQF